MGLFGEGLRGVAFIGTVLRRVNLLLTLESDATLLLKARERADGECGDPCLGDCIVCSWNREGFDGERDKDRRSCFMDWMASTP